MKPCDYAYRVDLELRILTWEVDRFYPRSAAAPWGPATTPFALLKGVEDVPALRLHAMKCPVCRGLWIAAPFLRREWPLEI